MDAGSAIDSPSMEVVEFESCHLTALLHAEIDMHSSTPRIERIELDRDPLICY